MILWVLFFVALVVALGCFMGNMGTEALVVLLIAVALLIATAL